MISNNKQDHNNKTNKNKNENKNNKSNNNKNNINNEINNNNNNIVISLVSANSFYVSINKYKVLLKSVLVKDDPEGENKLD